MVVGIEMSLQTWLLLFAALGLIAAGLTAVLTKR
jgi:hypothetical protein